MLRHIRNLLTQNSWLDVELLFQHTFNQTHCEPFPCDVGDKGDGALLYLKLMDKTSARWKSQRNVLSVSPLVIKHKQHLWQPAGWKQVPDCMDPLTPTDTEPLTHVTANAPERLGCQKVQLLSVIRRTSEWSETSVRRFLPVNYSVQSTLQFLTLATRRNGRTV